jgi:1-phosphofructokinase
LVETPRLEMADARGAGDSMTATMTAMLAQGADLGEAVRMGAAAGAVTVTRFGLGTAPAVTVTELAKRVRLVTLPDNE